VQVFSNWLLAVNFKKIPTLCWDFSFYVKNYLIPSLWEGLGWAVI